MPKRSALPTSPPPLPPSPTDVPGAQYGTEHDAAALLGLSAETLRSWRARRRGPPCWVRFGRSVRYDLTALRAWAAAQPGAAIGAAA